MNILGVELQFDFFDADELEIYERENKRVADRIKEPTQYEGKTTAEALRIQCGIVNDFFNAVFGEGTADKIFKGKNNIKDHMEAFGIVANEAMSCRGEFDAMADKYSPNRAERRQEQRQQNKQNSTNFQRHAAHGSNGKKRNG